ncbi:two-component system response regulator RppA [Microcoleus sp. B9-D4]|uniref:two-component system response regulator RppA n=1 Tax=Microcoleus sp. B9-D4 TaxID=2818711 RepID=UPI002FD53642
MRILLAEDEPDLGAIVQRTLSREKYLVDWVQDGTTAWNYLQDQWIEYTVAIFDWLLPEISGVELCQRLRQQNNPLPVLMLTAKDRTEDMVAGLDAGADDYLMKPFIKAELLARLRALQRRGRSLSPENSPHFNPAQLEVGRLLLDYTKSIICTTDDEGQLRVIPLTANEFRLLEYFMQHPNQILTRDRLLTRLWDVDTDPMSNVVAARIRLLRRKLADYGCDGMIETVHGFGYRLSK